MKVIISTFQPIITEIKTQFKMKLTCAVGGARGVATSRGSGSRSAPYRRCLNIAKGCHRRQPSNKRGQEQRW